MDESHTRPDPAARPGPASDRLDSWKKIAAYLKRDVSTVQRWERREWMPVHRHLHDKQGSVFAYRSELDEWWESRRQQLAQAPPAAAGAGAGAAEETPADAPAGAATPSIAPALRSRLLPRAVAVLAALLIAGLVAWFALDRSLAWRNPLQGARFSRLADFAGSEQAAAISPDGKFVAFLGTRDGATDAFVGAVGGEAYRNVTGGEFLQLTNPSIRTLGFSADSSLVSVWTRRGDGTQPKDVAIYAAPTAGGPLKPYLEEAAEFDWSRDGKWLVFHTTAPGDPIFVRERGAATTREVYRATAGVHCHYPLWSIDGKFIYFVRGVPPNDWDLWRIRPSGDGLEQLTHQNARVTYPVMLDARTLVYLATDPDGSGPWIYGLDVERPVPRRLTAGLETYSSLGASADGRTLLATTANPRNSLWRLKLDRGTTSGGRPTLVSSSALTPRFGPGFLVFVSTRGGAPGIWTLSGGVTRELWHDASAHITGAPAVSPDGTRIAFTVDDGARARLLAMDSDGAHLTVVSESLKLAGNPAWSPDGRSIISAALTEGEPRLTRIFLNGDPPVALLGEYSLDPVWSADGRFIVYSGPDVGTTLPVRAAAADGRPYAIPNLMLTRGARRMVTLKDGAGLIVLRGDIGHKDLWALDLKGGGERKLATLPADFTVSDFDVAADGSEVIVERIDSDSEMALIERPR